MTRDVLRENMKALCRLIAVLLLGMSGGCFSPDSRALPDYDTADSETKLALLRQRIRELEAERDEFERQLISLKVGRERLIARIETIDMRLPILKKAKRELQGKIAEQEP